MKTAILNFKDDGIKKAKNVIENDGVVAFPTETVYGLGVRYDSFLAYNKILELKKRPSDKALTLMLHTLSDIEKYVNLDTDLKRVIKTFMPGPLTLVLPLKKGVEVIGTSDMIGIRIPDDLETLAFLKMIEKPMFVTSANISNQSDALTFEEVYDLFNGKVELIVKGHTKLKRPSTVISIKDGELVILREGAIALAKIEEVYRDGKDSNRK